MAKLIVFGSARVDAFLDVPTDKADRFCNLNTHKCVVEFSYGAKIPMNSVNFLLGGNGANVAVGTKLMGIDSALVAELGQGVLADHAMQQLAEKINTDHVTQTEGVTQGFGAVIMYQGERTILSYYSDHEPPFPSDVDGAEWAYLTSVGEKFEEYYDKCYDWLKSSEAKLVFNPGGRQIAKGRDWMDKFLKRTHLIFVNREEAEEIVNLGQSAGRERQLLDALTETGVKNAVVTDGSAGAFAKEGDKYFKIGAMPIDAIERTGAGDAFSTGCMSAVIQGKSLQEGLLWGTVNSSSVIGYVGPQPGLLSEDKLGEWLDRAKSCEVRVEEF